MNPLSALRLQLGRLQRLAQPYFLPLEDTGASGWQFLLLMVAMLAVVVGSALLLSVGAALVIPTARSLVSSGVSETEQGVMLGSLLSLTGLASALGPVLAGLLYDRSAPASFLLQALVCLMGLALLHGVRPVEHPHRP